MLPDPFLLLLQRRPPLGGEEGGHIRLFQRQQGSFFVDAPRVARQASVGAHHPVARDQNGDLVVSHRAAHGLGGQVGQAPLGGQPGRERPIGRGLPVGDGPEEGPHLLLKGRAREVERHLEFRLSPRKIDRQPRLGPRQQRALPLLVLPVQALGKVLLPLKPQPGQAGFVRRQEDPAQRSLITAYVLHPAPLFCGEAVRPLFPAELRAAPLPPLRAFP